jgi:hypothetical protein
MAELWLFRGLGASFRGTSPAKDHAMNRASDLNLVEEEKWLGSQI